MDTKKTPLKIPPKPRRPKISSETDSRTPAGRSADLWLPPGFNEKPDAGGATKPTRLRPSKAALSGVGTRATSVYQPNQSNSLEKPSKPAKRGLGVVAFAIAVVCLVVFAFFLGARFGAAVPTESPQGTPTLAEADVEELDNLLAMLRSGDAVRASTGLDALQLRRPDVPSLLYVAALAALQAGDFDGAERRARESIAKRERISDSLALLAVIAPQKTGPLIGDPKIRAEKFVREAIAADPANPSPLLELASLLRYQRRNDEARRLLESSRVRMNPVNSHAAVETSMILLDLENTPDRELPETIAVTPDAPSVFAAAYLHMRRGDHPAAARILREARAQLSPETYNYLVNDPALRKFAMHPELKEFF